MHQLQFNSFCSLPLSTTEFTSNPPTPQNAVFPLLFRMVLTNNRITESARSSRKVSSDSRSNTCDYDSFVKSIPIATTCCTQERTGQTLMSEAGVWCLPAGIAITRRRPTINACTGTRLSMHQRNVLRTCVAFKSVVMHCQRLIRVNL